MKKEEVPDDYSFCMAAKLVLEYLPMVVNILMGMHSLLLIHSLQPQLILVHLQVLALA